MLCILDLWLETEHRVKLHIPSKSEFSYAGLYEDINAYDRKDSRWEIRYGKDRDIFCPRKFYLLLKKGWVISSSQSEEVQIRLFMRQVETVSTIAKEVESLDIEKEIKPTYRSIFPPKFKEEKKERGILNMETSFLDRLYRQVPAVIDITTGKAAIKTPQGTIVSLCQSEEGEYYLEEQPFEQLSVTVPSFATLKSLSDIKIGDIFVFSDDRMGFITGVKAKSIEVLKSDGSTSRLNAVKNKMLGQDGFMVVNSFTNMVGDNGNGLMQMLMLSQLKGDKQTDGMSKAMLMMSMFGNNDSANNMFNPQMLMMLNLL